MSQVPYDFGCNWEFEEGSPLGDDFYSSPSHDIILGEYLKWGGLGAPPLDDENYQCLDKDEDPSSIEVKQPSLPSPEPAPGIPAPGPNQMLPEPPNDGYGYSIHFASTHKD